MLLSHHCSMIQDLRDILANTTKTPEQKLQEVKKVIEDCNTMQEVITELHADVGKEGMFPSRSKEGKAVINIVQAIKTGKSVQPATVLAASMPWELYKGFEIIFIHR